MEQLSYLAKVNLCWFIFFACYWLLFRKHTFFQLNRAYLLTTLCAALIVPAVKWSSAVYVLPQETADISLTYQVLPAIQSAEPGLAWNVILFYLYLAGVFVLLLNFLKGIFKLVKLLKSSLHIPMEGFTLVLPANLPSGSSGSFSFLKYMVVSPHDYENHFETIFNHEAVHIKQWHSLDILLVEILKIVFWFNPALWLYKVALRETHEFLADEGAENKDGYASFLLSYAKHAPIRSISNQFFNSSLLRKRIYMIYKDRTPRWLQGKYLLLAPIFALMALFFAARVRRAPISEHRLFKPAQTVRIVPNPEKEIGQHEPSATSEKTKSDLISTEIPRDSQPKVKLERWPSFPGGRKELHKFLARNLIYPPKAIKDSVQGQALVSFMLGEDGSISDVKIDKGPRDDINEEAVRIVGLMPRWSPAISGGKPLAVRYTINIRFDIEFENLPLAVREKLPEFYNYSKTEDYYAPLKVNFPGSKELEKFFSKSPIDLSDSRPPTTNRLRYNITSPGPIAIKYVDMKVKIK